jgi:cell division protein FtsI (penicillin-binding protein 3)
VLSVPDQLTVYDYTFSDHDPHATEPWTVSDVVTNSSNVGTILLAREVGADRLDDYLRRFGFGTRTELDFPSESAGIMLDRENWSGTSIGAIPIGQGVAVTAMQMLDVYNTIANGGVAQAPRLLSGVSDEDGTVTTLDPAEGTRVVSEETAAQLRAMLANVVESGTGTAAAIDGYTVAGKTGTARKPQETGGYEDEDGRFHYVSTFAGFVPADDPQLSAIVVLDEPETSIYASETAAPVFAELAQFSLRHLGIAPADVGFAAVDVPEPSDGVGPTEGNDIAVLDR